MTTKKTTHVSTDAKNSQTNFGATKPHVSSEKKKTVSELSKLAKESRTILIASIRNLPASQFQEICKKLRGRAVVKVPKRNLIIRAIDDVKDSEIKKIESEIKGDVAILFSDIDAFELAGELLRSKVPAKAKPGQEAPIDIEVQPGPTGLVPGPAVSELGALGIQIKIEGGKINISAPKKLVKKGEKISPAVADVMAKLDIKPFSIGFVPLAAFDNEAKIIYTNIKIDREETLHRLKSAYGKALPFAVNLGYPSKDTISFIVGKAGRHGNALKKLSTSDAHKSEISGATESEDAVGNKSGEEN